MSSTSAEMVQKYPPSQSEIDGLIYALSRIVTQDLETILEGEAEKLSDIFNAASQTLTPYAKTGLEKQVVTPDGLITTYINMCLAYKAALLNYPLIVRDGLIEGQFEKRREKHFQLSALTQQSCAVRYFEPGVGNHSRMFDVGRFGFINLGSFENGPHDKSISVPYVSLPVEFMDAAIAADASDLILAFANLTFIVNHDWAHALTIAAISNELLNINFSHAPIRHLSKDPLSTMIDGYVGTRVEQAIKGDKLRDGNKIFPKDPFWVGTKKIDTIHQRSNNFEGFSMRLHREILSQAADQKDNFIESNVQAYMKAFQNFATKPQSQVMMQEMGLSPKSFALKMLAFNLVRAIPFEHRIVQNIISQDETGEALKHFEYMYSRKLSSRMIFGNGPAYHRKHDDKIFQYRSSICKTPQEYSRAVLSASCDLFAKAFEDARDAYISEQNKNATPAQVLKMSKAIDSPPALKALIRS